MAWTISWANCAGVEVPSLRNGERRRGSGAEGVNLQFGAHPALVAGIRISTDSTSVDGSLSGLLADRTAIEALILATAARTGQRV